MSKDQYQIVCSLNSSICSGSKCHCSWFDEDAESYKDITDHIRLGLNPFLCLIGVPANIFALLVFKRQKPWTTTNVYLTGLAVAYLMRLLHDTVMAIFAVMAQSDQEWSDEIDDFFYYFTRFLIDYTTLVSAWCIMGAAVDSCFYVAFPESSMSVCNTKRATFLVLSGFIVTIFVPWPNVIHRVFKEFKDGACECVAISPSYFLADNPSFAPYTFVTVFFKGVFVFIVLLVSSIKTWLGIQQRQDRPGKKHELAQFTGIGRYKLGKNTASLIKKLIYIELLYIICIIPDVVVTFLVVYLERNDNLHRGYCEMARALLSFNAAVSLPDYLLITWTVRQKIAAAHTANAISNIEAQVKKEESRREVRESNLDMEPLFSKSTLVVSDNNTNKCSINASLVQVSGNNTNKSSVSVNHSINSFG